MWQLIHTWKESITATDSHTFCTARVSGAHWTLECCSCRHVFWLWTEGLRTNAATLNEIIWNVSNSTHIIECHYITAEMLKMAYGNYYYYFQSRTPCIAQNIHFAVPAMHKCTYLECSTWTASKWKLINQAHACCVFIAFSAFLWTTLDCPYMILASGDCSRKHWNWNIACILLLWWVKL